MRKDWKYILYISLAFGVFVSVKLLSPKNYDWSVTFAHDDKNPYGAYAFNELVSGLFPGKTVSHSYKTLYEIKDSLGSSENIFIVCSNFSGDKEDTNTLLDHIKRGGSAFISAEYFWGHFADTLLVETYDYFFKSGEVFSKRDSAWLGFANHELDTTKKFHYRRDNIHNYFSRFDTTRTTVVARNNNGQPVTIRIQIGNGSLILNSTPLIFTNIYLLSSNNYEFVSKTLSYLPVSDMAWTEYYHVGRMEASTPLRFVLTREPLRWAYYITIISLLLFMLFEMKRKQRVIPIVNPLANTTMEFVGTIGNLYYQTGDHKNIAEKKINFFMDQLRAKYWLSTGQLDDTFIAIVSKKSGRSEEEVRHLVNAINTIRAKAKISEGELIELNSRIEQFKVNA